MQSSTTNTVITRSVKAPRPKVGNEPLNPSGREMRAHEREMEAAVGSALSAWLSRLMAGVTGDNVSDLPGRVDDRQIWQPTQDVLETQLLNVGEAGVDHGLRTASAAALGVTLPSSGGGVWWEASMGNIARWARQYSFFMIRDMTDARRRYVQQEIAAFTTNDLTINQLAERLERWFSPKRAKSIAITETTRAFARGNMEAWRATNGLIKMHRWNTANDEMVCSICGPLNGVTTEIGRPFAGSVLDSPPAHPNCRCWLTPYVEVE